MSFKDFKVAMKNVCPRAIIGIVIAMLLVLVMSQGCTRRYRVEVYVFGNSNDVIFNISAEVPKTITTDAQVDVGLMP